MLLDIISNYIGLAIIIWFILSAGMFFISRGEMSNMENAKYKKEYWKWSILLTVYLMIPIIGWIFGAVHIMIALHQRKKIINLKS